MEMLETKLNGLKECLQDVKRLDKELARHGFSLVVKNGVSKTVVKKKKKTVKKVETPKVEAKSTAKPVKKKKGSKVDLDNLDF
jgi:hypothetical protein